MRFSFVWLTIVNISTTSASFIVNHYQKFVSVHLCKHIEHIVTIRKTMYLHTIMPKFDSLILPNFSVQTLMKSSQIAKFIKVFGCSSHSETFLEFHRLLPRNEPWDVSKHLMSKKVTLCFERLQVLMIK